MKNVNCMVYNRSNRDVRCFNEGPRIYLTIRYTTKANIITPKTHGIIDASRTKVNDDPDVDVPPVVQGDSWTAPFEQI